MDELNENTIASLWEAVKGEGEPIHLTPEEMAENRTYYAELCKKSTREFREHQAEALKATSYLYFIL